MRKNLFISGSFLLLHLACAAAWAADNTITLMPPDGWPNTNWTTAVYQTPVVTATNLQGKNWLAIGRDGSNSGSAQVVYTGEGNQLSDFSGSVIFGISTPSSTYGGGVVLRAQSTAFSDINAYYLTFRYDANASKSVLELRWGVGDSWTANATLLASNFLSSQPGNLANNNQYLLDFSFVGNTLDATVWVWDSTNNTKGLSLATLSYTDTNDLSSSGYFALRGGRYGGNATTYFRDLTVVPEPTTISLLVLGGLAALLLTRRARKNHGSTPTVKNEQ